MRKERARQGRLRLVELLFLIYLERSLFRFVKQSTIRTIEAVLMPDLQSPDDRPGRTIVHKGLQAMVRYIVSYYMATTGHSQFNRIRQYRSSTLITESDTTICRCDQTDQSSQCGRRVRR